ncbi:MAG: hypothetical protein ACQER7_12005 [Bacteroidota bacterium]
MHTFNLKNLEALPYEQRDKNVLYETDTFKTRLIELKEGDTMPPDKPCRMESHVVFYIIAGKVGITINSEYSEPEEGYCVIAEPGKYQMEAKAPSKILGVQIQPIEK